MDENNQNETGAAVERDFGQRFLQLAVKINMVRTLDALADLLRNQLLEVFETEMASIFLIDSLKMQLVSWLVLPGKSVRKIRIPINKVSIAGYTATSRGLILIQDPYDRDELLRIDPELRFDSSWDMQAGIRTRQILATPIMKDRSLLGVIQLMNKNNEMEFKDEDKRFVKELANSLGQTLLRMQNG